MQILITGGSGCGKSEYAETLCMELACGDKIYLATMSSEGVESQKRIKKHRAKRAGKGFTTAEFPVHPERIDCKPVDLVLLECLSNLVAGTMFEQPDHILDADQTVERLKTELTLLAGKCADLVIVTNQICSDGETYDPYTAAYMEALAKINSFAAESADEVYEVVWGIPIPLKIQEKPL